MKYTTPYAELVALEAVSVLLSSAGCNDDYCWDDCPDYCNGDCSDEGEGF